MTVNDSRLLKGTLNFGATPVTVAVEGQTTNLIIEQQDGDAEDLQYVLSGESVGGQTTPGPWHITGSFIQDFAAAVDSFQRWSYLNRNTVVPFTFTPNDQETSPTITGQVMVQFLGLGGDVRVRNTRDIDWGIVGEPDFGSWGGGTQPPETVPDESDQVTA